MFCSAPPQIKRKVGEKKSKWKKKCYGVEDLKKQRFAVKEKQKHWVTVGLTKFKSLTKIAPDIIRSKKLSPFNSGSSSNNFVIHSATSSVKI